VLVFRDQAVTKTSPAINQYWMSDPVALFLVVLAFVLAERGCWGGIAAASLLSESSPPR
jgi:hypothetical protein